jgi:putative ABC transport system ATP-binding protein
MNAAPPLINIEGMTKVFYTEDVETHALSGIHLRIEQGEYVAISGPSGCGKSTLLSILGLLDSPTDGTYVLNGQPVQGLDLSQRARIRNREVGFIFQSFNLIGDLTVYENVELPLTYRGMGSAERQGPLDCRRSSAWAWRTARSISQPALGRSTAARGRGARSRGPAQMLLADEPTGNLDSKNGEAVMELLRELHQNGSTIVMVTHDSRFARHADRTVHMFDGRIVNEEVEAAVPALA